MRRGFEIGLTGFQEPVEQLFSEVFPMLLFDSQ